jgi:hypothetical protein
LGAAPPGWHVGSMRGPDWPPRAPAVFEDGRYWLIACGLQIDEADAMAVWQQGRLRIDSGRCVAHPERYRVGAPTRAQTGRLSAVSDRPRCLVKGCPVIHRGGPDRLCPPHQRELATVGDTSAVAGLMDHDRARKVENVTVRR